MTLWGVDLALALTAGLARHNTKAIELVKLEPDLDPNVHHTNLPIAIVIVKVFGEIGWAHVVALVEGRGVIVDGPVDHGVNNTIYPDGPAAIDDLIAALDAIATPWLADRHEQIGVTDATLAVRVMLRRLDPQTAYVIGMTSGSGTPSGYVIARHGNVRWPASVGIARVADGIRLTVGDRTRTIRTIAELVEGFEGTELPAIRAELAWCAAFVADVARARAVGEALLPTVRAGIGDLIWHLYDPTEGQFSKTGGRGVMISASGSLVTTIELAAVDAGVRIAVGSFVRIVTDPAGIAPIVEELLGAVRASLAPPPELSWQDYR